MSRRGGAVWGGGVPCGEGVLRFVGGLVVCGGRAWSLREWAWVLLAEGWWRGFGERWVIFFTFG